MKVYTESVYRWNGNSYELVREKSFDYAGPVALCKGDSTAQANEQMQMQFNQQLMDTFSKQFAQQSSILNFVKAKMTPLIQNPTGFGQAALNAMRTQATDTLSTQYQNAQKALNQQLLTRQGAGLPSGVNAQLSAGLLQQEAADKANAQNQITLANENLRQQNFWNALNVLSGNAAQYNPLGYGQEATSGGNTVANLSQAVTAANQSQLLGALGGIAGGIGGSLLSPGGILNKTH